MSKFVFFLPMLLFFGIIFLVASVPPEAFYNPINQYFLFIIVIVEMLLIVTLLLNNYES